MVMVWKPTLTKESGINKLWTITAKRMGEEEQKEKQTDTKKQNKK